MKRLIILATAACCLALAGVVQASPVPLQGRDINGNPVAADDPSAVFEYDANLNLTWLRNWNMNGQMDWAMAMDWAATLTVGAFGGWALPTALDPDGTGPCLGEAGCSGSPMGYMYYTELGNVPGHESNSGPFQNFQKNLYWSGTAYPGFTTIAWEFATATGFQTYGFTNQALYAVAVRPGDVAAAVPEPQTLALFLLALGAAVVTGRRRPARAFVGAVTRLA